jgi:hypothetical protein
MNKSLRYNTTKVEFTGISPSTIIELMKHTTYGSLKYPNTPDGVPNWALGQKKSTLVNSAMRHIMAYLAGEMYDNDFPDSMHLTAAMWNLMVLIHQDLEPDKYKDFDDLWFDNPTMYNDYDRRVALNQETVEKIKSTNYGIPVEQN